MYDVVIIGAGPAGISAALYAKRANKSVLVLYHGESQLEKAHKIDNYYGFIDGITGKDLYDTGIEQAKALGIEVVEDEALNVTMNADMNYEIVTKENTYVGQALILSTGNKKVKPNIKGVEEFDGKGISYCAICDGFFYRKKNIAVLGNEEYALSEAGELENIAGSLVILTNGLSAPNTDKYEINTKKIKEIAGEKKVNRVIFEDDSVLELDGIFIAQGIAGGVDFAKKLGILTEGDKIAVGEDMSTNLPGIFSCGDITGGLLQVCKAVYEGAQAGLSAVKYLKSKA